MGILFYGLYDPLLLLFNFVTQIVPDSAIGSSFSLDPVSFGHVPIIFFFFFFENFLTCWHYEVF